MLSLDEMEARPFESISSWVLRTPVISLDKSFPTNTDVDFYANPFPPLVEKSPAGLTGSTEPPET